MSFTARWKCVACGMTGAAGTYEQARAAWEAHYLGPCTRGEDRAPLGQPLDRRPLPPPPVDPAAWYDDDRSD